MLTRVKKYLHRYALLKTREQLLNMPERQLIDAGFSRHLLLQGIDQWPWRENQKQPGKMSAAQINSAIRELSDMSDQQLRDIGIDRGSIRHAVKNGVDNRPRAA